jgi:hypothetical protein
METFRSLPKGPVLAKAAQRAAYLSVGRGCDGAQLQLNCFFGVRSGQFNCAENSWLAALDARSDR